MAAAQEGAIEGQPIKEIQFRGLRRIPATRLREQIRSKVGEPYRREVMRGDIHRLNALGEFVPNIKADAHRDRDGVTIIFTLTERDTVVAVRLVGVSELDASELEDALALRAGDPLNRFLLHRDQRELRRRYLEAGHAFVEVEADLRPARGGVVVHYRIHEGPMVTVRTIRFLGNASFEKDDLLDYFRYIQERSFLGVLTKGTYQPDKLALDVLNLTKFYRSRGYLDARLFLEDVRFTLDRSEVDLNIRVVEGALYRVGSLEVEGTQLFTAEQVKNKLPLKPGAPFLHEDLAASRLAIERLYADRGYLFNQIDVKLRYPRVANKVNVLFDITEGQQITVERIEFRGNIRTRDDVIRRDLSIYPGEIFDRRKMDESKIRLGRHSWFRRIEVDFTDGTGPGRKNLILELEEQKTGNILFGVGISSDVGFFGRIVISQQNFDLFDVPKSPYDFINGTAFVGAGQELSVALEPGRDRSRYRISFVEPYFFGYPVRFRTHFAFFQRNRRDYAEGRLGGGFSFGRRFFTRDLLADLAYRLEDVTLFDIETDAPADVIEVSGSSIVSAAALRVAIDRQLIAPTRLAYGGWSASAGYEVGGGVIGGDVDFHRLSLRSNIQFELFRWPAPDPRMPEPLAAAEAGHVLGLRGRFGIQDRFGDTDEIPIFERFFAGGPRSIRGFEFRSVGPQEDDEPIGADALLVGTVEYNFPIPKAGTFLRGVVFVDAGTVVPSFEDLGRADLYRVSVGIGVRILVPGVLPAPVALDWGFPVADVAGDDTQTFSFSIGIGF